MAGYGFSRFVLVVCLGVVRFVVYVGVCVSAGVWFGVWICLLSDLCFGCFLLRFDFGFGFLICFVGADLLSFACDFMVELWF